MFIGREKELSELNRLYSENRFQLFVMYGRRRVGKTTLLKEFCKEKPAVFYSAEQSNDHSNLIKFSELIFAHYNETALEPFASWEKALLYLTQKQSDQQLILVIDEFPYLADCNPELLSVLQHLIDHILKDTKLFLILCGSYMGFMEKEVLGSKSPLFGRRTAQLQLKPFDYLTSIRFLKDFPPEEQLILYGAFGGTAMYLQQIHGDISMEENITNTILKPTGYLYEEPLLLLRQEVQQPGIYSAIIEAIASGATKANEISVKTGEESAKCLKYIGALRELGIVRRELPFGEKDSSRKAIYQLSDLMFRFWYRYVARNKTLLETDAQKIVWDRRIVPDLSNYMGYVFEIICKDFLLHKNSKGELPLLFTEIGRWWGTDKQTHEQIEIDLIARDRNDYLFAECKWRNEKLDTSVLNTLRSKAQAFGNKQESACYVLFSKSGFTKSVIEQAEHDPQILLFDLKDLFSL